MTEPTSTAGYGRVLVIDTQVVLETKPLDQLPWGEMGDGPILLLVCRQVQTEIDAKKGDGRLGERSRLFNRLLETFLQTRVPANLRSQDPRVDVVLMRHASIDWAALDDLDRDNGDDRIVAQARNALVDDPSRLEVLSHDMRPRDAAFAHGLAAVRLPEHWLREKSETPEEREIARLRRDLRTATADQPSLEISIEPIDAHAWVRSTVLPATEAERTRIQKGVFDANPPPPAPTRFSILDPNADPLLSERHDAWRDRVARVDLPAMHVGLSRLLSRRRLRVTVRNVGSISAEGVSLEIRSGNAILHAHPYAVRVFGSDAPRPESQIERMGRLDLGDLRSPRRDEPFTVYPELDKPGSVLSWSCRSFRQERSLTIEISVELEERTRTKVQLQAVVTAVNLKGDVRQQAIVDVVQRTTAFAEAYDIEAGRLKEPLAYAAQRSGGSDEVVVFQNDGSLADPE